MSSAGAARSLSRAGTSGARALALAGERAAVVAVLLVGFTLRLVAFPRAELGLDGFLSVGLARVPLRDMLSFSVRDVHPPLYYLGLKAWLAALGPTLPTARWPSVAAGVLAIALAYALARRLWGRWAGLLAAGLLAISPAHIFMSATVRDFAPGFALSLLSIRLFLVLCEQGTARPDEANSRPTGGATDETGRRGRPIRHERLGGRPEARTDAAPATSAPSASAVLAQAAALAAVSALALYTWYLHLLVLTAQVICLAVARPRRAVAILGAVVAGGIAYVPWVAFAFPELVAKTLGGVTVSGQPRAFLPLGVFVRSLGEGLVGVYPAWSGADALVPWGAIYWLALALAGIVLGLASREVARAPFLLAGVGLALGLAGIYALRSGWVGSDNPSRYLLAVIPFGLVGQVGLCALAGKRWRWLAVAATVVLLGPAVGSYAYLRSLPGIPWLQDQALTHVRSNAAPGDAVLFTDLAHLGLYQVFDPSPLPARYVHFAGSRFLWDDVAKRAPEVADDLAAHYSRVWFVNIAPHEQAESWIVDAQLASRFYAADRRWVTPRLLLKLYVAGPRPALQPVDYPLGGQIRLAGAATALDERGSVVYVGLEWQALRKPDADYTVFVHLADAQDKTVAQHDDWPGAGLRRTSDLAPGEKVTDRLALLPPAALPAGEYQVRVGLYRESTRLALPDGGNYVVVGRLRSDGGRLTLLQDRP